MYISGWPFAALIGVPIAVDILIFKKQWQMFINWSVISAVGILTPQILVDSYFYGKPVLASLNIVLYNVFTSHGPDLYGTEPATFYLINGILNFNIVFPMALLVVPALLVTKCILKSEVSTHGSGMTIRIVWPQVYILIIIVQDIICLRRSPSPRSTSGSWCSGPSLTRRRGSSSPSTP